MMNTAAMMAGTQLMLNQAKKRREEQKKERA